MSAQARIMITIVAMGMLAGCAGPSAYQRVFKGKENRIIPLPGGGGMEANRVKEGEWTVHDRQFYGSFFHTVDQEIQALQAT